MPNRPSPHRFDAWACGGLSVLLAIFLAVLITWHDIGGACSLFTSSLAVVSCLVWAMLLAPLAIIWTAIVFGILRRWIYRHPVLVITAMAPWLSLILVATANSVLHPPSHAPAFQRYFDNPLPSSATQIQVRLSTFADPGHIAFSFQTSPEQTGQLVEDLQLQPLSVSEDLNIAPIPFLIPGTIDPTPAAGFTFFEKIDPNGCGILLATDTTQTQVFLARHPLWAKAENERITPAKEKETR